MFLTENDYKKAEKNGVSRKLADDKFYDQGMTLAQTLKPVKVKIEKKEMTKEERRKYLKIASENDINHQRFTWRINNGWTPEEASTIGIGKRRRSDTFASKEKEYIRKAEKKGIYLENYYIRRKRGWSKERASTEPVRKRRRPKK